jgi:hypothetical protein
LHAFCEAGLEAALFPVMSSLITRDHWSRTSHLILNNVYVIKSLLLSDFLNINPAYCNRSSNHHWFAWLICVKCNFNSL